MSSPSLVDLRTPPPFLCAYHYHIINSLLPSKRYAFVVGMLAALGRWRGAPEQLGKSYRGVCPRVGGELEVEEVVHEFLHLVNVSEDAPSHRMVANGCVLIAAHFFVLILQVTLSALVRKRTTFAQNNTND